MNLLFFLRPGLYISKATVIKGNIITDANVYVAGTINGDIATQAMFTIEKNGLVNGNVHAKNVIVKGKIKGHVQSDGKVDVIKKGEIDGNVYALEVNIDEESLVKGATKLITANTSDGHDSNTELSESITPIKSDEPAKEEEKPQSWF
jgi:cytoskeletal protein CcmA (bactofilin family)